MLRELTDVRLLPWIGGEDFEYRPASFIPRNSVCRWVVERLVINRGRGSAVRRREQRGDTHRGPRDDDRLGMSGLRELVEPGTQLLPAVPSRCAYCGAAGGRLSARPPVLLPECFVRTADVRRAGAGADPTAQSAERAPASGAGRGRPRARRPGRCTDGPGLRSARQPQHRAAAGRRTTRAATSRPAGCRRRRVRHMKGPPIWHSPGRRRDPTTCGPSV